MSPHDESIWDQLYTKEHFVLNDFTKTWEYISEEEYNSLKPVVEKLLLIIAIATINKDKHGVHQKEPITTLEYLETLTLVAGPSPKSFIQSYPILASAY
eukprot:14609874-Ditylum_brightwellii.AAC.1